MALSNAEKQERYRKKIRTNELRKFEIVLNAEDTFKFAAISELWTYSKTETIRKLLNQAYDDLGNPELSDEGRKQYLEHRDKPISETVDIFDE